MHFFKKPYQLTLKNIFLTIYSHEISAEYTICILSSTTTATDRYYVCTTVQLTIRKKHHIYNTVPLNRCAPVTWNLELAVCSIPDHLLLVLSLVSLQEYPIKGTVPQVWVSLQEYRIKGTIRQVWVSLQEYLIKGTLPQVWVSLQEYRIKGTVTHKYGS